MSKKVTINDIAQIAKTSKTTVSFYLNQKFDKMSDETRERISQAIKETNYKPSVVARSLNAKGTKLIGILIGDITNSFSNQIVKGIERVAKHNGYQVMIGNSNYDPEHEDSYIESMLELGVDGFIIQPTSNFRKYLRISTDKEKPIVFFDSQLYEHRTSWVKTNNYDAVYDMVQVCIAKGYEQFMMITADTNRLSTRIERATGFIDSLKDTKKKYSELIIDDVDTDLQVIRDFFTKHLDISQKTLVFVPNCWALPLVFQVLKEMKYPMPQVGLVGFDNTEWTTLASPTVTTIVQPAFEEGQQATRILIDRIENSNKEDKQQVLNCYIQWLDSTF
ncbi:LacI family DNA-binding transcriptional regulator [Streptococcus suis]|nr:LacI family DNA-binding transcriptional regulator [Streptococcus suis]